MPLKLQISILLSFLISSFGLEAQIKINELVSNNISLQDEDNDTPDWIELRNLGMQEVNLDQWSLTDDKNIPQKWIISQKSITSNSYAFFWASGKDRIGNGIPRTLVSQGDMFRYVIPSQPVNEEWTDVNYDDNNWLEGATGFGYADGDDATSVNNGTISVFMRKKFSITDANSVSELILDIDYDDGFVAYLNDVEIARANISGTPPAYNTTCGTDHEAQIYLGGNPDRFDINDFSGILQDGQNVLAIQVHNVSNTSSDLTLIPYLTAFYSSPTNDGIIPPEILNFSEKEAHTNFKISSEGETIYLYDNTGEFIDSLHSQKLIGDVSIGLNLTADQIVYFQETTPDAPNSEESFEGILQANIEFSHPGGPTSNIDLSLTGNSSDENIRYTLDALTPETTSSLYTGPLNINEKTILRAGLFRDGYIPSPVQSKAYLVNENSDLPIVSLITEPDNFFDSDYGIYVLGDDYSGDFPYFGSNIWEDWERPVHFSLFNKNGEYEYEFNGGAKIFGGYSRANDQRSFSLFARSEYGQRSIDHKIFSNSDLAYFQSFVLRNAGNDWNRSHLRDKVSTSLMDGSGVDHQKVRSIAAYINGEYWGIYNLREKVNEHFLSSNHFIDSESIDILEFDGAAVHGSNMDYQLMISFLEDNNLFSDENYQIIADQVDVVNFASYYAAQIYYNNTDWPGNNIKFWRQINGKWKWILYDTDFGFGIWNPFDFQNNTLAFATNPSGPQWPNPPWSTFLFRKLLQNINFRHIFINRYADYMNSRFLPEQIVDKIDEAADEITGEMLDHKDRWGGNINSWNLEIANMKFFANSRQSHAKNHVRAEFNLPDMHKAIIENNTVERGFVQLNSLMIQESSWSGDYFETVPIMLTAVARPGFSFSHWEGAIETEDMVISYDLQQDETFIPIFKESSEIPKSIVINEINYNSSDDWDSGDWIELHNPNEYFLNISNWKLMDGTDNEFVLPLNSTIEPGGFLVLVRNLNKFNSIYPDMANKIGAFDFGLASEDEIRIYNQFGFLQDSVAYGSTLPWPEQPNGNGATLELISPDLDNLVPENWKVLHTNGSVGEANIEIPVFSNNTDVFNSIKTYPNPTSDKIQIILTEELIDFDYIKISNAQGELILKINREKQSFSSNIDIDLSKYDSGIYFIQVITNDMLSASSKVIKF